MGSTNWINNVAVPSRFWKRSSWMNENGQDGQFLSSNNSLFELKRNFFLSFGEEFNVKKYFVIYY